MLSFKPRQSLQHLQKLLFVLLLAFTSLHVFGSENNLIQADTKQITGIVSDSDGPLIGVNISIKDATIGTITDINGNYTLEVDNNNSVLIFSYIGYETQEVIVGDRTTIDVSLNPASVGLDEVIVTGYTTRKKGELTGSISSISTEDIEKTTNKDVAKSLAGKIPGLIVNDRGGYPGSTNDVSILIRGKSTLGNNAPLILIDGIPAASFSHLTPQDIASLSVLKDGAAAIYGARAANGVILITTRRGKSGKPVINFSSSYNLSSFASDPNPMSSEQYAIYNNEISERNGTQPRFTQQDITNYASGSDPLNYPNTNWADLTFADYSPELRSTLTVSGGTGDVKYFVSGDYIDQVGLYESGDLQFKQYQLRTNIDIQMHKNFKLGVDVSGRFGDRQEPGVDDGFIYKHIYTNEPTEVGVYPNGLPAWGGENGANPLVMSSLESGYINRVDNNLRSRISYDWDLNGLTEGLSIRGFAGIRKWTTDTKNWYTPWEYFTQLPGSDDFVPQQGYSQQGNKRILRETFWKFNELMLNTTVHYEKTLDAHTIRGFVGIERFNSDSRTFWAERRDFPTDDHAELFAGSDEGQLSTGGSNEWGRINYFGSLSYDFNKKYFVDLTLRRDGSSNFGPGKRFGTFPGAAVAWSIGEESFMDGTSNWLDALKIRASWAQMGNDQIAPFQFLTRYNFGGGTNVAQPNFYIFGENGTRYNGFNPANVPNPDITWETADMKNIGVTFSMFDYRLSADVNYFYQKREDILIRRNASIPDAAGLTLPQENLGKVNNFGWEFQLGWNDRKGDVTYNLGANLTQAKNKIVFLDEAADVPDGLRREGFPMDSYVVYPTDGIFRDQAQVDATAVKLAGTVEGEPVYIDTNGDGVIDAGDRVRLYSSNVPEIQYGITGGFGYKNFDVSFLLLGQAKAEMLVFFEDGGARPSYLFNDRWTPENRDAKYPRAFQAGDAYSGNLNTANNFQGADLWTQDASFLRLKEVELGYNIPSSSTKIGDVKVFLRGLNLLTMFSEVADLGLDPEASGYYGFRNSTYPSLKSYSLGFNIKFK